MPSGSKDPSAKKVSMSSQDSHKNGYNLAYNLAGEELAKISDIAQQCL